MSLSRFVSAIAWVAVCSSQAAAADLSKIDRVIAKEPVYASKAPKYCLLVFGPEAKTRVWLVLDGDVLFVDRNGNGDLTEEGERVAVSRHENTRNTFLVGDLTEKGGRTKHTDLRVKRLSDGLLYLFVKLEGKTAWWAGWDGFDPLRPSDQPQHAPIIHFNGPLTLSQLAPKSLRRGADPGRMRLSLGTPGLGKGSFAARDAGGIPKAVSLVADIEFPPKARGQEPIRSKWTLKINT